jgi:hypothetical protein
VCFDKICGRTFAFRAKWQPTWDTCSIQALKEDDAIIKKITDLFPNNEVFYSIYFCSCDFRYYNFTKCLNPFPGNI